MDKLPLEIWFLITDFCKSDHNESDLTNLIGINRFFFNLEMNRRYHEVTLDTADRRIRPRLANVSEPTIASRIHRLILHFHYVKDSHQDTTDAEDTTLLSSLWNAVLGRPTREPVDTLQAMVTKIVAILPLMTNVRDFRIVTWAMPHQPYLDVLHPRIWDVLGSELCRLSLCANLSGYRSLLRSKPSFPRLEVLELEFSDNRFEVDPTELQSLVTDVVPLVNTHCQQIKTLKIRSFSKLDLSTFFLDIQPLTSLDTTLIRIPFNPGLWHDPTGLRNFFMQSSPTLKRAYIRLTPMGLALNPTAEVPLYEWFATAISDPVCFSQLHTVDICPTNLPEGMCILYKCIAHACKQLKRLTVRDRYLKVQEAVVLSEKLKACEELEFLRINLIFLSYEVFDALARDTASLRWLWISVGEPHAMAGPHPNGQTLASLPFNVSTYVDTSADLHEQESFRESMEERRYAKWNVWDLTVYRGGSKLDDETMGVLGRSMPNVKSFWDMGDTNLNSNCPAVTE